MGKRSPVMSAFTQVLAASVAFFVVLATPTSDVSGEELQIEVDILVPQLVRLGVSPPTLSVATPAAWDFAAGFLDIAEPIRLTVHSNCPWELYARSVGDGTDDPSGRGRVPRRLLWRTPGRGFADMADEWILIASGPECQDGSELRLRLRVPLSWTETAPGRYDLHVEYRLEPGER